MQKIVVICTSLLFHGFLNFLLHYFVVEGIHCSFRFHKFVMDYPSDIEKCNQHEFHICHAVHSCFFLDVVHLDFSIVMTTPSFLGHSRRPRFHLLSQWMP